jgi:nucleoside recognition membrane protein YjiH
MTYSKQTLAMFLLPSMLGLFLFMTPISYGDTLSIPVAIIAKELQALLASSIEIIVTSVIALTAVLSIAGSLFKAKFICNNAFSNQLFNVSPAWLVTRILGAVFVIMTANQLGPEIIWSKNTGGLLLGDLLPILFSIFIFAGLLLPLLLNFGLLELIGTILTKVMRPVFNLPGRSAIGCTTSWLGDGTVGVMMTSKQFEDKTYTQREAAIVGTTFTAVSITFSMVVISQVSLGHMFLPFYLTVCLAGIVAALIVPRLPPLRHKQDVYIDGTPRRAEEETIPQDKSRLKHGFHLALERASEISCLKSVARQGVHNAVDMVFAVLPVVMAIGTVALILAEHTSVFEILGKPFIPYLELLQVPEAAAASKTIMVGFADMFIPSILIASVESDMTRFIVAALSVSQLIYMSEVGALLIGSKIPVNFVELFAIFILRTLITLPVISLTAHLIF